MLNVCILMGRLTRDPEVRISQGEKATMIARFTLAVPSRNDTTIFVDCNAFGKTAEFIVKYFRKGLRVVVRGSLDLGKYETNDNNGNPKTVWYTRVCVDAVDFADGKQNDSTPVDTTGEGFMVIPDNDEELPFK